jgi:hypothetical protein
MPKSEGTKIPEPKKQDIPVNIPPKVEPLPGFPVDEEAKSPQILTFEGILGKTFEDLPKDIKLKPIKSGEVFVKTGGSGKRSAPLTEDGEALLENFEKVVEYYNANNIPTPGLKDMFDLAGGNNIKKFREEQTGKEIKVPLYNSIVSSTGPSNQRFKEIKAKLIPIEEKINNYVGNVMLDPDADWRQFINPERHLAKKFGLAPAVISKMKTKGKIPNYTNNKRLFSDYLSKSTFTNKFKDGTKYQTIGDIILRSEIRPPSGTLGFSKNTFDKVILESALRYNKRIQNSQTNIEPEIRFIDDPTNMDYKDVKFVYKGKTFQLDPTEAELTDREMTKNALPESARKINELAISLEEGKKKYENIFPEVFKAFENLEKFKETKVDGKSLDYLIKKKKFDTDPRKTEEKDFIMKRTSVEVDHKEGVLKPFDIRVIDRDINRKAGLISRDYMEGKTTLEERNAAFENLGYNKDYENFDDFIEERKQFATEPDEIEKIENMVNEKFGLGTMTTADEAPEPDSSILRRLFERFNKNNMAEGGRVGFSDGSPNPEVMAQIKELLSGLNNTEVMDNALKNNAPSLEESMFGTKEESNLLQRLNQTLDPRAYPYYAAQITKGVALAPEFAGRLTLAAPQYLGDLIQGKNFKKATTEFGEKLDPKFTQEKIIEGSGLQKILDDMDQDITGSQRTVGDLLKIGGESLGPISAVGYIASAGKAANQVRKQIQKYAGSAEAAKELEKSVEEKASSLQMSRREFNTLLAGGGIIGLVKALGLDTIFPAAKTVAQKAAPKVVTTGGTPKYFFDFVNLIKTKGDDITDKAATLERQKVYNYNGYELTEDISTGKISIRKDTEGSASYYIGDGEYDTIDGIIKKEEITYDPPETILDDAGKPKRVPDSYEENTLRPDEDGGSGDVEAGLDSIDDILNLLSKDGKTYSKDELLEMGIRPDVLTESGLKTKKAGGGIIKLAGDESGPPPKSGPTPHGLPYVAKNVRPIKERK